MQVFETHNIKFSHTHTKLPGCHYTGTQSCLHVGRATEFRSISGY